MNIKPNNQTRIEWIDILRGLGILLVVMGHSFHSMFNDESAFFLHQAIYSFHMPLFFIAAGVAAALSSQRGQTLRTYSKKTFIGIGIPYITWAFMAYMIFSSISDFENYSFSSQLNQFINGSVNMWFLPALLMLKLFLGFYILFYRKFKNELLQLIVLAFFFVISFTLHHFWGKTISVADGESLEWLTNAYIFFPSFFFGVLLIQNTIVQRILKNPFCIATMIVTTFILTNTYYDFRYGNQMKNIIGICTTYIIILYLQKYKLPTFISNQLKLLGQNSLIIYLSAGIFQASFLVVDIEGASAIILLCIYAATSLLACYASILLSQVIQLSPLLSFFLLGKRAKRNETPQESDLKY